MNFDFDIFHDKYIGSFYKILRQTIIDKGYKTVHKNRKINLLNQINCDKILPIWFLIKPLKHRVKQNEKY